MPAPTRPSPVRRALDTDTCAPPWVRFLEAWAPVEAEGLGLPPPRCRSSWARPWVTVPEDPWELAWSRAAVPRKAWGVCCRAGGRAGEGRAPEDTVTPGCMAWWWGW